MGDLRLDGVSFSGYGNGTLMLGGVNYTRSGGGSGSISSIDSGVPRTAMNTPFTLDDNISNYDLIVVVTQWVGGDGNPYVGSLVIPTDIITTNSSFYVIGGNFDRMIRITFLSDTSYQIVNHRAEYDAVGGMYGVKL